MPRRLRLTGGPVRLSEKVSLPAIRLPKVNSHVVAFGSGIIAILLVVFTVQHLRRPSKAALVREATFSAPAMGYATEVAPGPAPTQIPLNNIAAPPRSLKSANSPETLETGRPLGAAAAAQNGTCNSPPPQRARHLPFIPASSSGSAAPDSGSITQRDLSGISGRHAARALHDFPAQ